MEENNTSDFTLYILLSISGILVIIDGIELLHMVLNWEYALMINLPLFERCIKYELISKTVFSCFSFIAAFSALVLTVFLLFGQQYFIQKVLKNYLLINYTFFGPLMLGVSSLGVYYWNDLVYVCDKNNLNNKELSASNSITIAGCFLISLILTLIFQFMLSLKILLNSILRRRNRSNIIGKFFWYIVYKQSNGNRRGILRGNHEQDNSLNNQHRNNQNNNNNNNIIVIPMEDNREMIDASILELEVNNNLNNNINLLHNNLEENNYENNNPLLEIRKADNIGCEINQNNKVYHTLDNHQIIHFNDLINDKKDLIDLNENKLLVDDFRENETSIKKAHDEQETEYNLSNKK